MTELICNGLMAILASGALLFLQVRSDQRLGEPLLEAEQDSSSAFGTFKDDAASILNTHVDSW